jgi:hypothetical protein
MFRWVRARVTLQLTVGRSVGHSVSPSVLALSPDAGLYSYLHILETVKEGSAVGKGKVVPVLFFKPSTTP